MPNQWRNDGRGRQNYTTSNQGVSSTPVADMQRVGVGMGVTGDLTGMGVATMLPSVTVASPMQMHGMVPQVAHASMVHAGGWNGAPVGVGGYSSASGTTWLLDIYHRGGWPELEGQVSMLQVELINARQTASSASQREAESTKKLQAAQQSAQEVKAALEKLKQENAKVEDNKKKVERRLSTAERERREKNEEVSRLHLQLRGAVDGLKRKTEDVRRLTSELATAETKVAALGKALEESNAVGSAAIGSHEKYGANGAGIVCPRCGASIGQLVAKDSENASNVVVENGKVEATWRVLDNGVDCRDSAKSTVEGIVNKDPFKDSSLEDSKGNGEKLSLPGTAGKGSSPSMAGSEGRKLDEDSEFSIAVDGDETLCDSEEDDDVDSIESKKLAALSARKYPENEEPGIDLPLEAGAKAITRNGSASSVTSSSAAGASSMGASENKVVRDAADVAMGGNGGLAHSNMKLEWTPASLAQAMANTVSASSVSQTLDDVRGAGAAVARGDSRTSLASSSGTQRNLRPLAERAGWIAMPACCGPALLPFKIAETESAAMNLDFDIENISDMGTRLGAIGACSSVLSDVLAAEVEAMEASPARAAVNLLSEMKSLNRRCRDAVMTPYTLPSARHSMAQVVGGYGADLTDLETTLQAARTRLVNLGTLQRRRQRHVGRALATLNSILVPLLSSLAGSEAGGDGDKLGSSDLREGVKKCVARYESWQSTFSSALGAAMSETDQLLVKLTDAVHAEKVALAENRDVVLEGVMSAEQMLRISKLVFQRLQEEHERQLWDSLRASIGECDRLIVQVKGAQESQNTLRGLWAAGRALALEIAAMQGQSTRAVAELQRMRLHGSDPDALAAAEAALDVTRKRLQALDKEQEDVRSRLKAAGISASELATMTAAANDVGTGTATGLLSHSGFKIMRTGLSLGTFSSVEDMACARGNMLIGNMGGREYHLLRIELPKSPASEAKACARLEERIAKLATLDHPSLAPVLAMFYEDGFVYLQRKLLGKLATFEEWLASPRDVLEICDLFLQLLQVLAHVHRRGLVVQALALNNVFVQPENGSIPVIMDFELLAGGGRPLAPAAASHRYASLSAGDVTQSRSSNGDSGGSAKSGATESSAPLPATKSMFAMSFIDLSMSAMGAMKSTEQSGAGSQSSSVTSAREDKEKNESAGDDDRDSQTSQHGFISGYIPPELEDGSGMVAAAADIWAFGIMLFRAIFRAIEPIPNPTRGGVEIPDHPNQRLRELLGSLLRIDPSERPSADQALAGSLFANKVLAGTTRANSTALDSP